MEHFSLGSSVRSYPKALPYEAIKNDILGERYDLSLTFIGSTRARALNERTRQKTYVPDVLSFPLTGSAGEVYICPTQAERKAHEHGHTPTQHIGFLFIHGCLHLKGYRHGATMEAAEQRFLSKHILRR